MALARDICLDLYSRNLFLSARPELVEGYLRALKETLQQVQGERGIKNNNSFVCTVWGLQ